MFQVAEEDADEDTDDEDVQTSVMVLVGEVEAVVRVED